MADASTNRPDTFTTLQHGKQQESSCEPTSNVPAFQFSFITCKPNLRLTKTIYADKSEKPFDDTKNYQYTFRETDSFEEFAGTLLWLASQPTKAIIRGQPIAGMKGWQRRLLRPDVKNGDPATIEDRPRRWIPLDLDNVEVPHGLGDPDKLAEAGYHIRDHVLPKIFQQVTCIAAATASTGRKGPTIARLRLFFKLSGVTDNNVLYEWAEEFRRARPDLNLDPRVLLANQLIYTARPVFDGCSDPVPPKCRVVVLDGPAGQIPINWFGVETLEAEVKSKANVKAKAQSQSRVTPKTVCSDMPDWMVELAEADAGMGIGPVETSSYALAQIKLMFNKLDGCPKRGAKDGRHITLTKVAWELAHLVAEGEISEAKARKYYFKAAEGINNDDKKYSTGDIERRIDDAFKDGLGTAPTDGGNNGRG